MAYIGLKQLDPILTGSLQVSGSSGLTGSFSISQGSITVTGNVSGSSTSTGSFGTIRSVGLPLYVSSTNVGIGTTSPGVKLAIEALQDSAISIKNTEENAQARIVVSADEVMIGSYSDHLLTFIQNNNNVARFSTNGNVEIGPGTSTSNAELFISGSGNVGIGTTDPGVALEVIGSISGSSTSTGSFAKITTNAGNFGTYAHAQADELLVYGSGSEVGMTLASNDISGSQYINFSKGAQDAHTQRVGYIKFKHGGEGGGLSGDRHLEIGVASRDNVLNVALRIRNRLDLNNSNVAHNGKHALYGNGLYIGDGDLEVETNITATHITASGDILTDGRIYEQGTSVIDHATAMAIVFGG